MDNLKELRTRANMTQLELSERTRIPVSTIRAYESGRRKLESTNVVRIFRIVSTLKCSLDEMFDNPMNVILKEEFI